MAVAGPVGMPGHVMLLDRIKALAKWLLAKTPYRVVRVADANRFQAMESCMLSMKKRGFSPGVVIDAGAHLGDFSLGAKKIFPDARFHLVEPQAACAEPLRTLSAAHRFTLHECALAEREGQVFLLRTAVPGTGAYIKLEPDKESAPVRAATLDSLFDGQISLRERVFLKLDLQGYELHALRGGRSVLRSVEVIVLEVSFYAQAYEPSIRDLVAFLDDHEFQLYDVASLSARQRDNRLHQGDVLFVRRGSSLLEDKLWS